MIFLFHIKLYQRSAKMACYVIGDPDFVKLNMFKIGKTTLTKQEICDHYTRCIPEPEVFLYYETDNCTRDEKHILDHFKEYRYIRKSGALSEWVIIEFEKLKSCMDEYFKDKTPNPICDIRKLFVLPVPAFTEIDNNTTY